MRIMVIGGEGFIGSHLIESGNKHGHQMVNVDCAGKPTMLMYAGDMTAHDLEDIERVIWSAGVLGTVETFDDPESAVKSNILDALHVLRLCLDKNIHFTYITLGNTWLNPYSITKNCMNDFCRMYLDNGRWSSKPVPVQVGTTYNVFGPRQKVGPVRKIVPYFLSQLIKGEPIELFFEGKQHVDMVYAPDLADAIIENDETGFQFYGSAVARTVKDVAIECGRAMFIMPEFIKAGNRRGETGEGAIAPYKEFIHETPFEQAIALTAKWYKENIHV